MKKGYMAAFFVVILSFAVTFYFYPQLPEEMVTHWNSKGEPDGHMSKLWGSFLVPLMSLGFLILFVVLPKIDPLKANYKSFGKYYHSVVVLIMAFLFYIHTMVLMANSGYSLNMTYMVVGPLSILFILIGYAMTKTKRNWFMGIRTPWTLNSDKVWKKTHEIGGKLFGLYGAFLLIALLMGDFLIEYLVYVVVVPVVFIVISTFVYSYYLYKKEVNDND